MRVPFGHEKVRTIVRLRLHINETLTIYRYNVTRVHHPAQPI